MASQHFYRISSNSGTAAAVSAIFSCASLYFVQNETDQFSITHNYNENGNKVTKRATQRSFFNKARDDKSSLVPIRCADGTKVIPYQPPSRDEQIERLKNEEYDVLIIGGGCVGTGTAIDASKRGLRVALVESDDFGAGTSGRSTKLIHGGVRYLENAFKKLDYGEYELVKEALEERKHMLLCAPYMNKPLPIMIPMYKENWYDYFKVPYYLAGVKVYDFIAGLSSNGDGKGTGVPPSYFMNKKEAIFQFPMIEETNLLGAIVYYDGQMNDTRMNLHLALTATQHGSTIASRVQVLSLIHENEDKKIDGNGKGKGPLCGAIVKDHITGETFQVKTRAIVNATGMFVDSIRSMDDPETKPIIKGAAGVHVVLPDHYSPSKMGLIVPNTADGRVLFFLPWEGGTIAGTTDTKSELTMTPIPSDRDIGFILREANNYLKKDNSVSVNEVRSAWSGIRPLVKIEKGENGKKGKDTKSISRSHYIEVSPKGKLITIAGGKWTTYRKMAEDTVDTLLKEVPACAHGRAIKNECETKNMGIIGADRAGVVAGAKFDRVVVTLRDDYGLPKDVAYHLVNNYGTRALQIAEITRYGSEVYDQRFLSKTNGDIRRISSRYPYIESEIKFAVENEYALTPIDILGRRTRLAYIDSEAAKHATKRVVQIMGDILKWSRKKKLKEEQLCYQFLDSMNMEEKATSNKNIKE